MYAKYHTEAVVLSCRDIGESDRLVALYTRDFGLVKARASAARKESSRMRYAIQNYTHSNVSLVRGKRGWRVAGATALETAPKDRFENLAAFARIATLMTRMVIGEEEHGYLFAVLSGAHRALLEAVSEQVPTIEILTVARILFALGYISVEAYDTALFAHGNCEPEHLIEADALRVQLLGSINTAMKETHL